MFLLSNLHTHVNLINMLCCNPNLVPTTKARACKVAGQKGNSGVTPHAPVSARECEGMNPHTPK